MTVRDENANSYTLTALEEWTRYDVRVAAYNKVGISSYSAIITDRTRESGQYLPYLEPFHSMEEQRPVTTPL